MFEGSDLKFTGILDFQGFRDLITSFIPKKNPHGFIIDHFIFLLILDIIKPVSVMPTGHVRWIDLKV